jgi:hypothetical protein
MCRDTAFFGDRREAEKLARPGRCAYCGGILRDKRRGALYCDDGCRKAHSRKTNVVGDGETRKIADTAVIESVTYRGANRGLGQSLVLPVSTSLGGTERDLTTEKESSLNSAPSERETGRLLPNGQQSFEFFSPSDQPPIQR